MTVAASSNDSPQAADEAFRVLTSAVGSLIERGRPPTASEVRLEMRDRTYNGFSPQKLGFARFRDFLAEAENLGHVTLDRSRPGDVSVSLAQEAQSAVQEPRQVRSDLWKAFIDWKPQQLRYYDIERDQVVQVPKQAAPLEPQSFQVFRRRLAEVPANFVQIEPVTMATQLEWMKEFTSSRTDLGLRKLLESALEGEKPAKVFVALLKKVPSELNLWRVLFSSRVRAEVERWKQSSPHLSDINIDRDKDSVVEHAPAAAEARRVEAAHRSDVSQIFNLITGSARNFVYDSIRTSSGAAGEQERRSSSASELRSRLHAAIDRMPVEELRAIRLPVGYLFEG